MNIDIGVILAVILGAIFSVFGYLWSKKDSIRDSQIDTLEKKDEELFRKITALEVKVAEDHYPKGEMDRMFDKLTIYLNERFNRLENSLEERRRFNDR